MKWRIFRAILRDRFAPDAVDSIPQDMAKFMYFKRTRRNMGAYSMEFDILRLKAGARMLMGSGFPDESACVSRMRNAALTRNEETSVSASLHETLALPEVSAQMRRLSRTYGCASRQDVLISADVDAVSEEKDFEAWMACRKAKRGK